MTGNLLLVILPLVALILAALSIAGLWLWWVSTKEEEESGETGQMLGEASAPPREASIEDQLAELDEAPRGSFFQRLTDSVKPLPSPASQPAPLRDVPAPEVPSSASSPTPAGSMAESMRLLRDLADGSLVIEVDGRRYHRLEDIADVQVRRRVLGNVSSLARFVGLDSIDLPEAWSQPPADSSPTDEATEALPPALKAAPPAPPSVTNWKTSPVEAETPRKSGLFQRGQQDEEAAAETRSMAEQIEELLQYRLTITPELSTRSIHIRPAADRGVRIEVDGRYYDGVGTVQDEQVREFLRETIRQWEARQ